MNNSIGIDFGTTKTMVSYLNPVTGRAELVVLDKNRDRPSIPTTIHQDEAGQVVFGEEADDQLAYDPEGYCRAFKLHLGENDPVLTRTGATAEALTERFLEHIKEECELNVFHGESIDTATITVPVLFSPSRKASLKRAAEAAGFSSVSFLPEPEAAGTAFLRDNPADKFSRALVLDWGGGTLDIAIISRNEDGAIHADRHCAEGRDDVGGEEMDRLLLGAGNELWRATFGLPLIESEENEPKLLREAEKVKIGLSRKDTATFRRVTRKVDVSRAQFKQLIAEMLDSAVELVQSSLAKNKNQGNPAPDAILLIGGTCQIPAVREAMETNFPELRVLSWHHSHEAVALGAIGTTTANIHSGVNFKFQAKYDWLKRERVPTLGGAIESGIYQTPDGGWQCNYDGDWGYGCAITLRPGEAEPYEVHGEICKRWYWEGGAFDENGRRGWLGYPISDEEAFEGDGDPADRISHFENGDIVCSEKTKETRIVNIKDLAKWRNFKFQAKYDWLKRERVPTLGSAIEPGIYQTPDGGWQCNYDGEWGYGCAITLRPGDAEPHEVHGEICKRWYREGGAFDETGRRGRLGYPISDEEAFDGDGDPADRISHFENGDIVWSEKTKEARVVNIKDLAKWRNFKFQAKYDWLKRERVPTLGGAIEPGIYQTPDGGWQCNYDGEWGYGCAITLRPGDAEPHEVHGEICKRWYREGGAFDETGRRGWLGYPISDEEAFEGDGDPADRIAHFENGDIVWSEKTKETRIVNVLTDEALRLFAGLSQVDGALNQTEVDFMEKWYPGSTTKSAWNEKLLYSDETIEALADNAATSYNCNKQVLSALMQHLCEFVLCDGLMNSSENAALSWINYFFFTKYQ